MCLQIRRIDHDRPFLAVLGGQADQDPGEDAPIAPPLPAIVQGLGRTILLRRIALPQAIAIDEDYARQDTLVIDAWLAVGLGKVGL